MPVPPRARIHVSVGELEEGTFMFWYTYKEAAKEPMALATSLAPWANDMAQADSTCDNGMCGVCYGSSTVRGSSLSGPWEQQ